MFYLWKYKMFYKKNYYNHGCTKKFEFRDYQEKLTADSMTPNLQKSFVRMTFS